jgi:hypothetical protein
MAIILLTIYCLFGMLWFLSDGDAPCQPHNAFSSNQALPVIA